MRSFALWNGWRNGGVMWQQLTCLGRARKQKPGYCSILEHEIKVNSDFAPKRQRAYRIPEVLKPEVDRQIKETQELGIIKPSNSEMASPISICRDLSPRRRLSARRRVISLVCGSSLHGRT